MLEHGGRLNAAARRYGIPLGDWLDLSTGIAPYPYPVPPLPSAVWQRLPEDDDGLAAAACRYYGAHRVLPLPGSQAGIQLLPRLRAPGRVVVLAATYGEYAAAWAAAGHSVSTCLADDLPAASRHVDVVMIGNPNNPTGERFSRLQLTAMAAELKTRGAWLIVDEAFADGEAGEDSVAGLAGCRAYENIVVLRSLGKFFGLAGARVGFALAHESILNPLADALGPWAVAHPARVVARTALDDVVWQQAQSARLRRDGARLQALLIGFGPGAGLDKTRGSDLFRYLVTDHAVELHDFFARRGILLRAFDHPAAVRIGLPASEAEWLRLADAIDYWRNR